MDAPCYFAQDKRTVDQIPVDRLMGPAAVIDITSRAQVDSDALVQVSDLEKWEVLTSRRLDGHILLIRSGWGSKWGDDEAFRGSSSNDTTQFHFPGVSREAAQWLVDNRSIRPGRGDPVSGQRTVQRPDGPHDTPGE
ncbi:uncharacterized protein CEXT_230791 [Caerostris extrusa]|uniref:Uncharacterized protein n=1 Tax=Caerostris extrusa TaxID=172846 RepID=A0AAV4RLI2_CAEEX|nr:uncharacterized protein CEXT_230791 [Caerostris extrusa]